jgi:2-aminoadipate transaminase
MKFSKISKGGGSVIRELLKYAGNPNVISLGGGLPNSDTFPANEDLVELVKNVDAKKALQYGKTEGVDELRDAIVEFVSKKGINATRENVLIATGSQQALDLVGDIFIEDNWVAMEIPTYVAAITAFKNRVNSPNAVLVELDNDGIVVEEFQNIDENLSFIYTIPTFQNPSGITMSEKKRKQLLEIAIERDIPIIEDDPYGYLRYSGRDIPPIKSFDDSGNVVYLGTFSKIFAPGMRIGYVIANEEVIDRLARRKQSKDLHTSTFNQYVLLESLNQGIPQKVIQKAIPLYKHKRDLMLKELEKHFTDIAEWTKPDGGLFLWLTLNDDSVKTDYMLEYAVKEKGILYIPGNAFTWTGEDCRNSMRLNFSYPSDNEIVEGVKRLYNVFG